MKYRLNENTKYILCEGLPLNEDLDQTKQVYINSIEDLKDQIADTCDNLHELGIGRVTDLAPSSNNLSQYLSQYDSKDIDKLLQSIQTQITQIIGTEKTPANAQAIQSGFSDKNKINILNEIILKNLIPFANELTPELKQLLNPQDTNNSDLELLRNYITPELQKVIHTFELDTNNIKSIQSKLQNTQLVKTTIQNYINDCKKKVKATSQNNNKVAKIDSAALSKALGDINNNFVKNKETILTVLDRIIEGLSLKKDTWETVTKTSYENKSSAPNSIFGFMDHLISHQNPQQGIIPQLAADITELYNLFIININDETYNKSYNILDIDDPIILKNNYNNIIIKFNNLIKKYSPILKNLTETVNKLSRIDAAYHLQNIQNISNEKADSKSATTTKNGTAETPTTPIQSLLNAVHKRDTNAFNTAWRNIFNGIFPGISNNKVLYPKLQALQQYLIRPILTNGDNPNTNPILKYLTIYYKLNKNFPYEKAFSSIMDALDRSTITLNDLIINQNNLGTSNLIFSAAIGEQNYNDFSSYLKMQKRLSKTFEKNLELLEKNFSADKQIVGQYSKYLGAGGKMKFFTDLFYPTDTRNIFTVSKSDQPQPEKIDTSKLDTSKLKPVYEYNSNYAEFMHTNSAELQEKPNLNISTDLENIINKFNGDLIKINKFINYLIISFTHDNNDTYDKLLNKYPSFNKTLGITLDDHRVFDKLLSNYNITENTAKNIIVNLLNKFFNTTKK